jgi:FkbM family methyltransferase
MTLQAAALVGARGRVDSFEPNPACRARLEESLARNRIGHVRVHPVGLSDAPGRLVLSVITAHAGMGTLAEPRPDQAHLVTGRFKVEVCCGDGILLADPHPVRFVKIDVEGFELRALQGLRGSLERWLPLVVTEMQRDWLARAGTTRSEVFRFMAGLAYTPFGLATQRRATRHRLALQAIGASDVEAAPFDDFAWLHPATRCSASLRDALM